MANIKNTIYKNTPRKEYSLTEEQRNVYRENSRIARENKIRAQNGELRGVHKIYTPNYSPNQLMPQLKQNGITSLSLFSGGGGLDLGFDKAGYSHIGSYELIPICGETLSFNRPDWDIYSGPEEGDVTKLNWENYKGVVDIIHGGPPCQPFSIAGQQEGENDDRNMWPEFSRAINTIKPKAFVAENVPGLMNPKFSRFVQKYIINSCPDYKVHVIKLNSAGFGVPQIRKRIFFIGFVDDNSYNHFVAPEHTYSFNHLLQNNNKSLNIFDNPKRKTMGVREALGLPNIGVDSFAPTLRSTFTGKRNTTSILNSSAAQKSWGQIEVWPNGVQKDRKSAALYPAKENHFRLSVHDCALIQGFPDDWIFKGAVYQILGQIGNSVCPPVAYNVALAVSKALIG